jgi:hypothetical protein
MKLIQHRYRLFNLTRCIMAAGESYFIPASENDTSIGVWCVRGGTRHDPSKPMAPVHLPQAGEGLLLNGGESAWSNAAVGHNDLHLHAPVDTEWVCVSENGNERHGLSALMMNGDAVVPAGSGLLVVSGSVSLEGITAGPDQYFAPRAVPIVVTGIADAILIRP